MAYFYDIECYPNFFQIKFLPDNVNKKLVEKYIKADIANATNLLELEVELGFKKFQIIEIDKKIIKCDIIALYTFLKENEKSVLIGYNNSRYDDIFIQFLLGYKSVISPFGQFIYNRKSIPLTERLYYLSQDLINKEIVSPLYTDTVLKNTKLPFLSIDILAYALESVEKKSLKQLEIMLNWHNVQELPYPFNTNLTLEQINEVDIYNSNDVLATRHAFLYTKEELDIRFAGMTKYGTNIVNATRSKIADIVIGDMYCKYTNTNPYEYKKLRTFHNVIYAKDLIFPIKFELEQLQKLLENISKKELVSDKIDETFIIDDIKYNFKQGGLHSYDRGILQTAGESNLIDVDGTSYYPNIVLNNKIFPEHLNKAILYKIGTLLVSDRIEAKHKGLKVAEVLKITINTGLFGKYGDIDSPLCDFKAKYTVTLNGQLYLLKLIEMMHFKGIKAFSANTDGVTFKVPNDKLTIFQITCQEWEKLININLEHTYYEKYIRRDVNNYMAIYKGFSLLTNTLKENREEGIALMEEYKLGVASKLNLLNNSELTKLIEKKFIKTRGCFRLTQDIRKGYNCIIIAKALLHYFLYNILPEITITHHTNIYDFILSQKSDKSFKIVYEHIVDGNFVKEIMPNSIRYYATKKNGTLVKIKGNKRISLLADINLQPFNKFYPCKDFKDYNINYNYYIAEAYKIIYAVLNLESKQQKNYTYGGFFD